MGGWGGGGGGGAAAAAAGHLGAQIVEGRHLGPRHLPPHALLLVHVQHHHLRPGLPACQFLPAAELQF